MSNHSLGGILYISMRYKQPINRKKLILSILHNYSPVRLCKNRKDRHAGHRQMSDPTLGPSEHDKTKARVIVDIGTNDGLPSIQKIPDFLYLVSLISFTMFLSVYFPLTDAHCRWFSFYKNKRKWLTTSSCLSLQQLCFQQGSSIILILQDFSNHIVSQLNYCRNFLVRQLSASFKFIYAILYNQQHVYCLCFIDRYLFFTRRIHIIPFFFLARFSATPRHRPPQARTGSRPEAWTRRSLRRPTGNLARRGR